MENIDGFMSNKINDGEQGGEQYPFREEYWEQALFMLKADEQARARRRRYRRAGLLVLALGFVGLGIYRFNTAGSRTDTASATHIVKGGAEMPSSSAEASSNTMTAAAKAASSDNMETAVKAAPTSNKKEIRWTASRSGLLSVKENTKVNETRLEFQSLDDRGNAAVAGQNAAEPEAIAEPVAASANDREVIPEIPVRMRVPVLERLPARFPRLESLPKTPVRIIKPAPIEPIAQGRPWSLDVLASTVWHTPSAGEKSVGGTAGLLISSQMIPNWRLSAGIVGHYLPGRWRGEGFKKETTELYYGFGVSKVSTVQEDAGLIMAEMPFSIHRTFKQFEIQAGVSYWFLLRAMERHVRTYSNSLDEQSDRDSRWVGGDASQYKNSFAGMHMGVQYSLWRRLNLSFRAGITPTPNAEQIEAITSGSELNFIKKNHSLFWLSLGAAFRLR